MSDLTEAQEIELTELIERYAGSFEFIYKAGVASERARSEGLLTAKDKQVQQLVEALKQIKTPTLYHQFGHAYDVDFMVAEAEKALSDHLHEMDARPADDSLF